MRKSVKAWNASCDAVVDLVDQGSLYTSGRLNLYDADSTIITYLSLSNPAFMDATDGTSFAHPVSDATAFRDATAALYDIVNRDASVIWDGTVSDYAGLGDWKLPTTIIYEDSTVAVNSFFYSVPR